MLHTVRAASSSAWLCEEKARAALAGSGAVGVVTMQVLGREDAAVPRMDVRSAGYRSFWGNYRWSSQVAWTPGPSSAPHVWVETLVHSLAPDTLLWSGRSRTADPNEVTALFDEVAQPRPGRWRGPACSGRQCREPALKSGRSPALRRGAPPKKGGVT